MMFPAKIAATALVQTVAKSTIPTLSSAPTLWNGVALQCLSYGISCAVGNKSFQGTTDIVLNEKFAPFLTIRGGANIGAAGAAPILDIDRAGFRLSSIEQYCIVSSILMGAAIGKYIYASSVCSSFVIYGGIPMPAN